MLFVLEEGGIYYSKWRNVLHGVGEVWQKREGDVEAVAGPVKDEASDQVPRWLLGNVDRTEGGFGAAPKFVADGLAEKAAVRAARPAPALRGGRSTALHKLFAETSKRASPSCSSSPDRSTTRATGECTGSPRRPSGARSSTRRCSSRTS